MAVLFLITGDLAAGKSTLAANLAVNTQTFHLVKDTMKEVLADDIGFETRAENKKLSIGAVSMMKYIFSEYAPLKRDLILEANFHRDEIEYFANEAFQAGYKFLCLYLEGETDELYKRFMHRIEFEHRHRAHMTADIMSKDGFAAYLAKSRLEVESASIPKDTLVKIAVKNNNFDEVYSIALQNFLQQSCK